MLEGNFNINREEKLCKQEEIRMVNTAFLLLGKKKKKKSNSPLQKKDLPSRTLQAKPVRRHLN